MATLNQQIENIFETSSSANAITRALRGLGIEQREINNLFFQYGITKQSLANITFGVEIECYNVEREEIAQRLREAGVACYVEGYKPQRPQRPLQGSHRRFSSRQQHSRGCFTYSQR